MPRPVSRSLLTFAFVAHTYTTSGSALEGTAPLLTQLIGDHEGETFNAKAIASDVEEVFGQKISPLVIENLAPTLEKLGALKRIGEDQHNIIYRCMPLPDELRPQLTEKDANEILVDFRSFARSQLKRHGFVASDEILDEALLAFLLTTDFLSTWVLVDGTQFHGRTLSLKKKDEGSRPASQGHAVDAACALFVDELVTKHQEKFGVLVQLSWGSLISEVIFELQVGGSPSELSGLSIFVDSPILLDLLDLGSEEQGRYASDLYQMMKRSGAQIATFSHVVDEMRSAVETTLARFVRGEPFTGPMAARLRKDAGYATLARAAINSLEKKLLELGISIEQDQIFEDQALSVFFPEKAIDELRNRVGILHRDLQRRERDAKSIAYALRARKGDTASAVSATHAVFVTRNTMLCSVYDRFSKHSEYVPSHGAPACISDRQLAGILWFCSGGEPAEGVNLTRLKMIANCANAVVPRLDVVSKMGQILFDKAPGRLVEYEALMRDSRAAMCLTRETLNVVSLVDADSAEQLLASMRAALTEESQAAFEAEKFNLLKRASDAELRLDAERLAHSRAMKEAASREQKRKTDMEEVVRSVRAELDADHSQQLAALASKVKSIEEERAADRSLVLETLIGELATFASFIGGAIVAAYFLLAFSAASLLKQGLWGAFAGAIISVLSFWVVPNILVDPLIRWVVRRRARDRVQEIRRTSGIALELGKIVEKALEQKWRRQGGSR